MLKINKSRKFFDHLIRLVKKFNDPLIKKLICCELIIEFDVDTPQIE